MPINPEQIDRDLANRVLTSLVNAGNSKESVMSRIQGLSADDQKVFISQAANKLEESGKLGFELPGVTTQEEAEPTVSRTEAFLRGAAQGATFDFGDELSAVAEKAIAGASRLTGIGNQDVANQVLDKPLGELVDENRQELAQVRDQRPGSFLAGNVAGGLATTAPLAAAGTAAQLGRAGGALGKAAGAAGTGLGLQRGASAGQVIRGAATLGSAAGAGASDSDSVLGTVADAAGGAATGGVLGAAGVGAGRALGRVFRTRAEQQADALLKADKDFSGKVRKLIFENDPDVVNAIRKNPDKVNQLVTDAIDSDARLGFDGIADSIEQTLATKERELINRVGNFRRAVERDTNPSVQTKDFRKVLDTVKNRLQLSSPGGEGRFVVGQRDLRQIDEIQELLEPELLSPSDVLKITDKIDGLGVFSKNATDNLERATQNSLKTLRRKLKLRIRNSNKEWAAADQNLSVFKELTKPIKRRVEGDTAESLVSNIFGKGKTRTRNRLASALDIGETGAEKPSQRFLNEINETRAAVQIKNVFDEVTDPIADKVNRNVRQITDNALSVAQVAGTGVGIGAGAPFGVIGAGFGAQIGSRVAKNLLTPFVNSFAKKAADPRKVLKAATIVRNLETGNFNPGPVKSFLGGLPKEFSTALQDAAKRGGQALAATHQNLLKDPGYVEAFEKSLERSSQ